MESDTNVQVDTVLEDTETELEDTGSLPVEEPEVEKPLTTKELKAMLYEMFEPMKRELQGATDRSHSAIEKVRLLESVSAGVEAKFGELDPDAAESAKRDAELNYRRQQDQQRKQQESGQQFYESLVQHIQGLDIDINDERLDWSKNERISPIEGRKRLDKSIEKIIKEKAKVIDDTIAKKVKEEQAEVDSVDTSALKGVGKKRTRQETLKRYSEGDKGISTKEYEDAMEQK